MSRIARLRFRQCQHVIHHASQTVEFFEIALEHLVDFLR